MVSIQEIAGRQASVTVREVAALEQQILWLDQRIVDLLKANNDALEKKRLLVDAVLSALTAVNEVHINVVNDQDLLSRSNLSIAATRLKSALELVGYVA